MPTRKARRSVLPNHGCNCYPSSLGQSPQAVAVLHRLALTIQIHPHLFISTRRPDTWPVASRPVNSDSPVLYLPFQADPQRAASALIDIPTQDTSPRSWTARPAPVPTAPTGPRRFSPAHARTRPTLPTQIRQPRSRPAPLVTPRHVSSRRINPGQHFSGRVNADSPDRLSSALLAPGTTPRIDTDQATTDNPHLLGSRRFGPVLGSSFRLSQNQNRDS